MDPIASTPGGTVAGASFPVEISPLDGRQRLGPHRFEGGSIARHPAGGGGAFAPFQTAQDRLCRVFRGRGNKAGTVFLGPGPYPN